MLPPKKYFKDHPEYYSLYQSNRRGTDGQLCFSNPDVVRVCTENVLTFVREKADRRPLLVSIPRGSIRCRS